MKMVGKIFNWYTQAMDASLLDIRSVGTDLLFMSVFTAALCIALGFLVKKIINRKVLKYIFFLICGGMSVCVEYVMRNLTIYVLRVREILDNVKYIMSYENNLKSFLAALGLTSEYSTKIDTVVYYMNSSEWKKAESGTGYMSWYMKGIHRSLDRTVRLFGYHLGRPGYEQGRYFVIIAILVSLILAIVFGKAFLVHSNKKLKSILTVCIFIGSVITCELLCFGTILYFMSSLIVLLLLLYSLKRIRKFFCRE